MRNAAAASPAGIAPLRRDAFVWSLYLQLGLFAFLLTMVGPMVPYLRDEFAMGYALAGLHQSAFALGMVLMGLFSDRVIRRLGLTVSLYGGMADMMLGLLIMILARSPYLTLAGLFVMSLGGTVALAAIQTAFANGPEPHRGAMIMEANVVASGTTMLVPLVLLAGTGLGLGWRIVLPAGLVAFLAVSSFGLPSMRRHQAGRDERADAGGGKLGPGYWRAWAMVFLGVSVEWAVGFWCMTYLLGLPGATRELAAAGTVVLGLSAMAGRFIASRLGTRASSERLMALAAILTAAGFPLYWSRMSVPVAFVGLALCGLGSSNFYPLGFAVALRHARGNAAKASSYMPIASGSAIGLAPFLLGRLADLTDMRIALWYIPAALAAMGWMMIRERKSVQA